MVRVAVGLQLRARARALVLRVHARHATQERQRGGGVAGARERCGLADQHLGGRIRRLDRVVALHIESAVESGTGRERAEPRLPVGLVPDAVAVHAAPEVLRCDRGELAELGRVRLVPRAPRHESLGVRPARRRAGERYVDPYAVLGGPVDQRVDAGEVVVHGGRLVPSVELCLGHGVGPLEVHALPGHAERAGGVVGLVAAPVRILAIHEDGVVLDRELHSSCRFAVTGLDEAAGEDGCGRDQCGEQGSGVTGYCKHGVNLLYGTGTAVRARRSAA